MRAKSTPASLESDGPFHEVPSLLPGGLPGALGGYIHGADGLRLRISVAVGFPAGALSTRQHDGCAKIEGCRSPRGGYG